MIDIDISSAKITTNVTGALPGINVGTKKAGVHLTKGYISPDVTPATKLNESPVEITGNVDLHVDTRAEADQVLNGSWFFGFIQVARLKAQSAAWEGRRKGEGSVNLVIVGIPVSNDIIALDSDPINQPFFNSDPHAGLSKRQQPGQRILVNGSNKMGDHPNYREFLITANSLTKSRNFLRQMFFTVEFTSVFVGRDGQGPIRPIAHVKWNIDLLGKFRWKSGKAIASKGLSSLTIEPFSPGLPANSAIASIVSNPGPPLIKGIIIQRYRDALLNPLMRQEFASRSLLLPNDFFT